MLKLGEFVHYRTKFALELLGICLAFANKHQMFQGGFDDYFSRYPETDSVLHAGEVLKIMRIHKIP